MEGLRGTPRLKMSEFTIHLRAVPHHCDTPYARKFYVTKLLRGMKNA